MTPNQVKFDLDVDMRGKYIERTGTFLAFEVKIISDSDIKNQTSDSVIFNGENMAGRFSWENTVTTIEGDVVNVIASRVNKVIFLRKF